MSSAPPPAPERRQPPAYTAPVEPHTAPSVMTQTTNVPSTNGSTQFGRLTPWLQMGMAGVVAFFAWMMLKDNLDSNRIQHADTMQRIDKSLDRVETNQQLNSARFEALQQDLIRKTERSDTKHEDLVKEVKASAEKNTEAILKCTTAIEKMISKMPGDK